MLQEIIQQILGVASDGADELGGKGSWGLFGLGNGWRERAGVGIQWEFFSIDDPQLMAKAFAKPADGPKDALPLCDELIRVKVRVLLDKGPDRKKWLDEIPRQVDGQLAVVKGWLGCLDVGFGWLGHVVILDGFHALLIPHRWGIGNTRMCIQRK